MKLGFNLKNKSLPRPESLKPKLFEVGKYWYAGLAVAFLIFAATAFIGFKLFYSQYFGSHDVASSENFEGLVNIKRLKAVIEKRNSFIKEEAPLPRDPSL